MHIVSAVQAAWHLESLTGDFDRYGRFERLPATVDASLLVPSSLKAATFFFGFSQSFCFCSSAGQHGSGISLGCRQGL